MEMDKLVRRKQLLGAIGLSCTTQWRMEKASECQACVKLGTGRLFMVLAEVEGWFRGRERVVTRPLEESA